MKLADTEEHMEDCACAFGTLSGASRVGASVSGFGLEQRSPGTMLKNCF